MPDRDIAVFFYGLFMDADELRRKGFRPARVRRARVRGFALRIGQRATLVPEPTGCVHGVLMELPHAEVDRLYSEPGVQAYRPEAVLAEGVDGEAVPALCFNLPEAPDPTESNAEYAARLRELGRRLELPSDYVEGIA